MEGLQELEDCTAGILLASEEEETWYRNRPHGSRKGLLLLGGAKEGLNEAPGG